jgi:hypothetical protein
MANYELKERCSSAGQACKCSSDEVIIIEDDEPPVGNFPLNFGHWTKRLAVSFERVAVSRGSAEWEQVTGQLSAGLRLGRGAKSELLQGYSASILQMGALVHAVNRLENPLDRDLYIAARRKMVYHNTQREEAHRFTGSGEEVTFHGTKEALVKKIATGGFKVLLLLLLLLLLTGHWQAHMNRSGRYGVGTYSDRCGQIAMYHAVADAAGQYRLLVCRVLVGNQVKTGGGSRGPLNETDDSGGDGTGHWIVLSHLDTNVRIHSSLLQSSH